MHTALEGLMKKCGKCFENEGIIKWEVNPIRAILLNWDQNGGQDTTA
jgi:hypothetical protein